MNKQENKNKNLIIKNVRKFTQEIMIGFFCEFWDTFYYHVLKCWQCILIDNNNRFVYCNN